MARRIQEANPLQGSVFDQDALLNEALASVPTATYEPAETATDISVVHDEEGLSVNLVERAEHLIEALGAFGLRNQRLGFGYASNTPRHNGPIWGNYRSRTPIVQSGAEANTEMFFAISKQAFWRATGWTAMRGKGVGDNKQIDEEGKKMWRAFATKYEHTSAREKRDKYIKKLEKVVKTADKSRKAEA